MRRSEHSVPRTKQGKLAFLLIFEIELHESETHF